MGKNATRITPPVVSIARETVEHCCQKKSEGALLDVPRYGELLGEAILQCTCKFSCYANGKFNLSLTSLPEKAHPPSEANLFRRQLATRTKITYGSNLAQRRRKLFCPVMAFEWQYLSVDNPCSQFSCRLTTATAVMERTWSPVTRT